MKVDLLQQRDAINNLRFVLACMVVVLHSWMTPIDTSILTGEWSEIITANIYNSLMSLLSQGICRAAVPTFFILSGFLFFNNMDKWNKWLWASKIKRRLHTLLIPYIIWTVYAIFVYSLAQYIECFLGGSQIGFTEIVKTYDLSAFWGWSGSIYPCNIPLWFIRDLIILNIVSPILFGLLKYTGRWLLAIVYACFLFNIIEPVAGFSFEALFFYLLGMYLGINKLNLIQVAKSFEKISYVISVITIIGITFTFCELPSVARVLVRIYTLFGAISVICIVYNLLRCKKLNISRTLIDSTFIIYVVHNVLLLVTMQHMIAYIIGTSALAKIITYLVSPIVVILICVGLYWLLKHLAPRLCNILVGGR